MLSRLFARRSTAALRPALSRLFSEGSIEGIQFRELPQKQAEEPDFFKFTFACPHKELFQDAPVRMVVIPGSDGRFGVTPGHMPVISEMQPGVVSLYYERSETSGRQDHYFVAGGIATVHPDASCEIAATEAVLLSDLDLTHCREGLAKAKEKMIKADTEKAKIEAEVEIEAYEAIEKAASGVH